MKKPSFLALGLCALAFASCSKAPDDASTQVSDQLSDSLSTFFGRQTGALMNRDLKSAPKEFRDSFKIEEFVKGIQYVLNAPEDNDFAQGMGVGLNLRSQIAQFRDQGVRFNKEAFLNNLKSYFLADTITEAQASEVMMTFNLLQNRVGNIAEKRRLKELAESPAAKKALAAGEAYFKAQTGADAAFAVTEEGIAVKTLVPGDTTKAIGAGTPVTVTMTQTLVDGTELGGPTDQLLTPANLPPFMGKALQTMHPGGQAVFIVPGPQAYGLEGVQGVVGPNETIILTATVK